MRDASRALRHQRRATLRSSLAAAALIVGAGCTSTNDTSSTAGTRTGGTTNRSGLTIRPASAPRADPPRVLLFSRTTGFRHDSIPEALRVLHDALTAARVDVVETEDAAAFSSERLAPLSAVVFVETTGDVLDDDQQRALEAFVRRGGGWAGVHSATDTEHEWPFYATLAGARFANHGEIQSGTVVISPSSSPHPSVTDLPGRWERVDEWYNFRANPRAPIAEDPTASPARILATLDEATVASGATMGADHPLVWCRRIDAGRSWYSAMGHTVESWQDPRFIDHVAAGIISVLPSQPDTC